MSNSADNNDVVILSGARTPQGRLNGQLASFTAVELGAHAIRAAIAASGLEADQVDAVIMGQVLQAGAGPEPCPAERHRRRHRLERPHGDHQQGLPFRADRRDRRGADDPQR